MISIRLPVSLSLDSRAMSHGRLQVRIGAAALAASISLLSGCAAGVLAGFNVVSMASELPSNEPHWVETNRVTLAYPVADVYARLVEGVEHNGREIVERSAESHSLLVSYPFSLLNWGGTLRITCVASDFGTTITILGDGRDAAFKVRDMGEEVLDEVDGALRRQPRTL